MKPSLAVARPSAAPAIVSERNFLPLSSFAAALRSGFSAAGAFDARLADEQRDHEEAEHPDEERDQEQVAEGVRRGGEQHEREDRADHRARGVHRAMHAEGEAEVLLGRGQRDHRVARGRADALAGAVEQDQRAEAAERAADEREAELAHRREAVAERGDGLVAVQPVAEEARDQPHDRARALVEAVDDPVLERREAERRDQVQRQDRRDHLRRDVRQQRARAEQQHGPADPLLEPAGREVLADRRCCLGRCTSLVDAKPGGPG